MQSQVQHAEFNTSHGHTRALFFSFIVVFTEDFFVSRVCCTCPAPKNKQRGQISARMTAVKADTDQTHEHERTNRVDY